jgi:hypothetical protein
MATSIARVACDVGGDHSKASTARPFLFGAVAVGDSVELSSAEYCQTEY